MDDFIDWWQSLSAWIRFTISTVLIVGSAFWFTHPILHFPHCGKLIALVFALGIILLFLGPGD